MGTLSRITGRITINPGITWHEFLDAASEPRPYPSQITNGDTRYYWDPSTPDTIITGAIALEVDTRRALTDDGTETVRRTITAIIPIPGGERVKAYDIDSDIARVAREFCSAPGDDTRYFTGYLECTAEDDWKPRRWYVRSGLAVPASPEVTFTEPEGPAVGF